MAVWRWVLRCLPVGCLLLVFGLPGQVAAATLVNLQWTTEDAAYPPADVLRLDVLLLPGEDRPEPLWFHSAEDILLQKLRWYRRGGETSDRQWRDVIGLVRVQGARLDRAYLATGAARLGVEDLLEKALRS